MEIKSYLKTGVEVFELHGKLDVNTAPQVQEELMAKVGQDCRLVLDMKDCDYVSSAGLRFMLVIAKQLTKVGGHGAIANLLEEVKDVMEMTGFDNLFNVYEDVDEAVTAVMKGDIA